MKINKKGIAYNKYGYGFGIPSAVNLLCQKEGLSIKEAMLKIAEKNGYILDDKGFFKDNN